MKFDPAVWGPHYWFFLHSVAESYPISPNQVTKRKYYDLIINFPLFIPDEQIGNKFSQFLDKYPVTPYLDSRDSFVRWVHFIHNKINALSGKEEISLPLALDRYKMEYKPKVMRISETINIRKHFLYAFFILACFIILYIYYK
jgi:hypothetical protein